MYLATTAIEDFWDKKQQILFLGEWCKLHERENTWKNLDHTTFPSIWSNINQVEDALIYCDSIYEKLLISLTDKLNDYHHTNNDIHYYRIILGNWLYHFIHQFYDKFFTVKKVFDTYKDIDTILLDPIQYYTPVTFQDYQKLITEDDLYALQFYSQIISELKKDKTFKKTSTPLIQKLNITQNSTLIKNKKLTFKVLSLFTRILHKKNISLTQNGNLTRNDLLKLIIKSKFKFILDHFNYNIDISIENLNLEFRKTNLSIGGKSFEKTLGKIVMNNLPIIYIEGYKKTIEYIKKIPIRKTDAFITTNGISGYKDVFSFYLAEKYSSIKIFNIQHGGGYGIDYLNPSEKYERSVSSIFFTSGWTKDSKTIPLSNHKYKTKCINYSSNKIILFATNEMPRYVYRLHYYVLGANYLDQSLKHILEFLQILKKKEQLLLRSYPPTAYKWKTIDRIEKEFSNCRVDDFSINFKETLKTTRVYVSNCANTTYMEALVYNVPTILFLNRNIYKFNNEAQKYFDLLEKVGILYYSPIPAAEHLNKVYNNIEQWWERNDVQNAKNKFISKYAYYNSDWVKEWNNIIISKLD